MIKMASATVEIICFLDEISVILSTSLKLETYIKGHHVYKEVWISEVGEKLKVLMEPDNRWTFEERRLLKICTDDFLLSEKLYLL